MSHLLFVLYRITCRRADMMKPYQIKIGEPKFRNGNDRAGGRGCTKQDKTTTRNANRGMKKAFRRMIKNEVKNIQDETA